LGSAFLADVACGLEAAGLFCSRAAGTDAVNDLCRERLAELVAVARERSPYYRRLYANVGDERPALRALPPVDRAALMAHFDEWATDRRIRRRDVERFVADPARIGDRFLDRYRVWKSSGSSGEPGLFVQDDRALAIYDALVAVRWLAAGDPARPLPLRPRAALVIASSAHYASIASWERLRRTHPSWDAHAFSVLDPLPITVGALNACRPDVLATYPSMLSILAGEKLAGRLRIEPVMIGCGGERLSLASRARIEHAFGVRVVEEYGASECLSIGCSCRHGSLHLNADWVILEPVEADGRPTPAGRRSHTVLLTNLANRVQPLIRYDLGDRITMRRGPCACGDPLPAFSVEGRAGESLALRSAGGESVRVSPLALATAIEPALEGHASQVARVSRERLVLRVERATPSSASAEALRALKAFLGRQGLEGVAVALGRGAPRVDPASGKLHAVVDEASRRTRRRPPQQASGMAAAREAEPAAAMWAPASAR
jgi:phenylacetate-coenzyme A ligase PaaK-like adenylate-forming protein